MYDGRGFETDAVVPPILEKYPGRAGLALLIDGCASTIIVVFTSDKVAYNAMSVR